jgi:hypothetical protein
MHQFSKFMSMKNLKKFSTPKNCQRYNCELTFTTLEARHFQFMRFISIAFGYETGDSASKPINAF